MGGGASKSGRLPIGTGLDGAAANAVDAAFKAADADQDGLLSKAELDAAIAKTVKWSPQRIDAFHKLCDVDGSGKIDQAAFRGLANDLIQILSPFAEDQSAEVKAGIIEVTRSASSQLSQQSYAEQLDVWAGSADGPLPKAVLLQMNNAAVARIGPLYIQQQKETSEVKELQRNYDALPGNPNDKRLILHRTRLEHQLSDSKQALVHVNNELEKSMKHLQDVRLRTAAAISRGLAADYLAYTRGVDKMDADQPGVLDQITAAVAEIANTGELKIGEEVKVEASGKLQRAKVRSIDHAAGTFELSLWTEVATTTQAHEVGFDTSKPRLMTLPRRDIYANKKTPQRLSEAALATAARRAAAAGEPKRPSTKDAAFMALLYGDAERTLPALHALCARVERAVPTGVKAIVAPLKGEARAAIKTLDKYDGDYSRLTDLARATLKCEHLGTVLQVLRALAADAMFEIILIKNRLMNAFDASETGGYRDKLLNLLCKETGHIVEVQVSLASLLLVKAAGGHSSYQLARLHGFFEERTFKYEGNLSQQVIDGIRCGLLRELHLRGESVGLSAHFDSLLEALRAPACALLKLVISKCDWPAGRELGELLDVVPTSLTMLVVAYMQTGGPLPGSLFERCVNLEDLGLFQMALTGAIPPAVKHAKKMKRLYIWGNRMTGAMPDELGEMIEIEHLRLNDNKLSGPIPGAALAKCTKLKELILDVNELSGPLPEELGTLKHLEKISASTNRLSGTLPAALFRCSKLEDINVHTNTLSGALPDELGSLTELKELSVSNNKFEGVLPASIGKCSKLVKLTLHNNKFSGPLPSAELAQLPQLQQLWAMHLDESVTITREAHDALSNRRGDFRLPAPPKPPPEPEPALPPAEPKPEPA